VIFNSLAFAVFLPLVLLLYYLSPFRWQNRLLLVASLIFYAWWDWRFLGLLAGTILVDFYVSHAVHRARDAKSRKRWLMVTLVSNILVLVIFKYSNFFIDSFSQFFSTFGFIVHPVFLDIVLPIGISFYTFMSMAYVIDVYRGDLEPTPSLFDFALFVSYFPHLVAGPILRAPQLLPQLTTERKLEVQQIIDGLSLIVIGLVRKVVIADLLAPLVDEAFANPRGMGSGDLWIRMWLFSIQLYGDFAGYSDIARGVSKLFGIELNVNFATPFLSQNITEFWRRWHISLSNWLRDYVYIPLGGNRKGKARTYLNNMLTMLIGGLWHGANWTYIVWGALNGLYLAVHKAYLDITKQQAPKTPLVGTQWTWATPFKVFFTFNLAAFAFLIFRAQDFETAWVYIQSMMAFDSGIQQVGSTVFILPIVALFLVLDIGQYSGYGIPVLRRMRLWQRAVVFGVLFFLVLAAGADKSVPFIYFQF
jgi:alginate O-acetyltransferase complex protein AlgI